MGPQTDKQHIQLMKQRFNIPDNIRVNTYYMGNSGDDINNAFNEPDKQVMYNSVPAPRMNFEFEDHIPVPFSPITSPSSSTDEENEEDELDYERIFGNNFSQSREYLEPSLPEHFLIHQNNPQTQQPEYVEPFSETKHSCYQTSTLNGVQLSQQDDEECNSENSYAALKEESLDDISDSDNSILRREEGELSPSPQ